MSINIKDLPCANKQLEFSRPVHVDLNRVSEEDFYILEDLKKNCSNIKNYITEYTPFKGMRDAFVLRIGCMGLTILVRDKKCIVVEIIQLVELRED